MPLKNLLKKTSIKVEAGEYGPVEARRDVAKECIKIVKEHAPDNSKDYLTIRTPKIWIAVIPGGFSVTTQVGHPCDKDRIRQIMYSSEPLSNNLHAN
jgi:hypothetical protein